MYRNKLTAIFSLSEKDEHMAPLTASRPIASLPFACRYRILDFSLTSISHAGVRSAGLFIGDSGRSVYDHIRSGKAWDLDTYRGGIFTYSHMHHKKALFEAASRKGNFYEDHLTFLERASAEYVFVSGSKVLANVILNDVLAELEESGAQLARLYAKVPREYVEYHPEEYIVGVGAGERLVSFAKEGVTPLYGETANFDMNMTLMRSADLIDMINKADDNGLFLDIDQLVEAYLSDYDVYAYEYKGYVANIDSIKAYYDASMDMLDAESFTKLFQTEQPIITKAQNGVPNYYGDHADIVNSQLANGSEIYGNICRSHIGRKVFVDKQAEVNDSIIFQSCQIGKGAKVSYAILDKSVVVEPGAVIEGSADKPIVIGKNQVIKAD
ncbi:glucose-1-phosphate adenylyltransferase [Aerococcus urinaehominis]|uniref:Glucose-1-phosphate adenylyltransferase n=1 Tax=Aerococcus urinaehominis TaxID=128944 RepID=A0A109RGG8_9LACT|nr:glucose-1-phosphate adenylyltransferase subunit GlgD [Aerococcus urinaehominis]AMB98769.1 glucose-1-phosphate adenylyltransferase [Aerococcus urinaehominis]SDM13378.1 glucose-1-phosphate adenylyltransferase [Aerococcus urinaehominis]